MTQNFDLLIRKPTIVNGTGEARYSGDTGFRGVRIDRIGDLTSARGIEAVVVANGTVVWRDGRTTGAGQVRVL